MFPPDSPWGPIIFEAAPPNVTEAGILGGQSPRYGILIEKQHYFEFLHRVIPTLEGVTDYNRVPWLDWGNDGIYFTYAGARVEIEVARTGGQTASAIAGFKAEGVRYLTKLGTCGATDRKVPVWSTMLSTGAVRDEGTSSKFLPINVPAVPDWNLTRRIECKLRESGVQPMSGITYTSDARLAEPTDFFGKLCHHAGVNHIDMETATLFLVGRYYGLKTASINIVTDPAYELSEEDKSQHMNQVASYYEFNQLLPIHLMNGAQAILETYAEIERSDESPS